MQKNLYVILPLALVIIIDTMGFGLILPVLGPLFMSPDSQMLATGTPIHVRTFYYGLTLAIFFICAFFASPILGSFSDQLGRKKVLLGCLFFIALSYILCAIGVMMNSVFLLVFGRALAGAAAGSQPIAQAAVIDISDADNKTANLSLISLCNSFGFAFGPLMAGLLSNDQLVSWFSYTTPFIVAAVLAALNIIALIFAFKETYVIKGSTKIDITKSFVSLKFAFSSKHLCILSLAFTLMSLAWGIYFQFISLFLNSQYQYGPTQIGWFMTAIAIIFAISLTFIIRICMSYLSTKSITILGFALMIIGLVAASIFQTQIAQWLCMFPVTIGLTLCYMPLLTLFSDSVDESSQGMIMGVTGSLGSVAWGTTGLIISILVAMGIHAPFIVAAILSVLGAILIGGLKAKTKPVTLG